jgi:hypothetical protein
MLKKKWGEILNDAGTVLWEITADMGYEFLKDGYYRKVELVSTPTAAADNEAISDRRLSCIGFMEYMNDNAHSEEELNALCNEQGFDSFSKLLIPPEFYIPDLKVSDKCTIRRTRPDSHFIIKNPGGISNSTLQLTAGATMNQVFTKLNLPWVKNNYQEDGRLTIVLSAHPDTEANALISKQVFAYLASLAEKEAEIHVRYTTATDSYAKNAWEVLPRTPKSEILDMIANGEVREKIRQLIMIRPPNPTDSRYTPDKVNKYKAFYAINCLKDMDAGKLSTEDTIAGEKMLLFEYRSPANPTPPDSVYNKWEYGI